MIRLQGIQFCNSYLRSENEDGDLMHDGMNIWDPWSFGSAELLMDLGKCSATMYNKVLCDVKYHTIQFTTPTFYCVVQSVFMQCNIMQSSFSIGAV